MGLAQRLLLAARGSGGFVDVGYSMTPEEIAWWQDQAALLDPDAYVFVQGTAQTVTVASNERYYVVNAWKCQTTSPGAGNWFHRQAHVDQALMLPEGHSITTSASVAESFIYYCRPSLVVDDVSDDRYADYQNDPRGLWFERMMELGELARFQVGGTATGSGQTTTAMPSDFTDGLAVHVSAHDVAWLIMLVTGDATGGMNTLNEISDTGPIRFAEPVLFPFKRTTFPKVRIQGVSLSEGAGNLTYVKIDGIGW